MMIPTATTIIKATTTPNTIYDTPLYSVYSSVNIDDQINDNYMIKLTSKLNYSIIYVIIILIGFT